MVNKFFELQNPSKEKKKTALKKIIGGEKYENSIGVYAKIYIYIFLSNMAR